MAAVQHAEGITPVPKIHFLNVKDGDCNIIEHMSGHVTVIDVCNAAAVDMLKEARSRLLAASFRGALSGDFGQKDFPVNPISYVRERKFTEVFRFILTHPDMDHMDGIKAFFEEFSPWNFWDTDNCESKEWGEGSNGGFNEEDWDFYTGMRDGKPESNPKRLTLYSGGKGQYYNQAEDGTGGGDGLHILAPTKALVDNANECMDFNDCSYVLLYKTGGHRILFGGDSHDATWEHILEDHEEDVKDVDLLIAPHHGRSSGRSYDFLDTINPALTLFGNADSNHLSYGAFNDRGLSIITNNQAGCILVDAETTPMKVYVTNEAYAKKINANAYALSTYPGYYYWGLVERD